MVEFASSNSHLSVDEKKMNFQGNCHVLKPLKALQNSIVIHGSWLLTLDKQGHPLVFLPYAQVSSST